MSKPDILDKMLPSQNDVEVGEEYLVPTTFIRRAKGGNGDRFEAIKIEVKQKNIQINECSHIASEGYEDISGDISIWH